MIKIVFNFKYIYTYDECMCYMFFLKNNNNNLTNYLCLYNKNFIFLTNYLYNFKCIHVFA